MIEEIWKDIKGYENSYQVSNLGIVKSLDRIDKLLRNQKGRVLKPCLGNSGYYHVSLSLDGKTKIRTIHSLVSESFLNHIPCGHKLVVNHKDFNIRNNCVDNLEIVTNRENTNHKHLPSTSKYTGVCWNKKSGKWKSEIRLNGKKKYLGYFKNEIDASNAYQKALNEHSNLLK